MSQPSERATGRSRDGRGSEPVRPEARERSVNQRTAILFIDEVLRRLPFRVHVVQTHNGAEFQPEFHWHLESKDIRHVCIRPRTSHLNGKVERSHRVDDQEFYQVLDKDGISDDIRLFIEKLREWEDYYNYHRPHGALGGQTPYERLLAKTRAEVHQGLRTLHRCLGTRGRTLGIVAGR